MTSLSIPGIVHTVISLVAVGAGIAAFVRDGRIDASTYRGRLYVAATVLTCLSGFFIFAHGGWGKPHTLGVLTLVVLAVGLFAGAGRVFGRASAGIATVALSLTFFFHLVPAVAEASTRLPLGAPLLASAEAPALMAVDGVMFLLFLLGAWIQLRRAGRHHERGGTPW